MYALLITFQSSDDLDSLMGPFMEYARALREVQGLILKTWIQDGPTLGGFHVFTSRQAAQAYLASDLLAGVTANARCTRFQVRQYAVMEELSRMTGTPLPPRHDAHRGMQRVEASGRGFPMEYGRHTMAGQKQIAFPGWGWNQQIGFSQAVRAGGLLFLAGQMPIDTETVALVGEGDIHTQARQTFENIKAVLEAAGSSMDDIVELVSYHTDMADLDVVVAMKPEYIAADFPAWTAVGVTALALPGQRLEIRVVAVAH